MAPKTLTKTCWDIYLGETGCELCGWSQDSLEVTYHRDTKLVDIDYSVGCYGGDHREDVPLEEAIEWIRGTKELWSEYGRQIATIAEDLEGFRD